MSILYSKERPHGWGEREDTEVRLLTKACSPQNWFLLLQNESIQTGGEIRT